MTVSPSPALIGQLRKYGHVEAADALESAQAEIARLTTVEAAAQQAADALYPFISMIAHAFDGDGRYYWTRDPTAEEGQAAIDATYAVSAALKDMWVRWYAT